MKLTITGKNMEVSEAIRDRIEKRLNRLQKYFWDDVEVQVRLALEKAGQNIVEITIFIGSTILRAEETSNDMYASADKAIDKIVSQLRKHHTKFADRLRPTEVPVAEEPAIEPEEESHTLVRVKRFAIKPMSVEDAIAQMEMLGHSFFLFIDDQTNVTSVVYRRNDGNYGLLEPENA
ncbi:MAG: ribosome-associated translation inhibitor RaiA [Eubacteriales bacterium]|nr:ribosome-associated translation inhibitor RaiA [Eubacteriales bacterium]